MNQNIFKYIPEKNKRSTLPSKTAKNSNFPGGRIGQSGSGNRAATRFYRLKAGETLLSSYLLPFLLYMPYTSLGKKESDKLALISCFFVSSLLSRSYCKSFGNENAFSWLLKKGLMSEKVSENLSLLGQGVVMSKSDKVILTLPLKTLVNSGLRRSVF